MEVVSAEPSVYQPGTQALFHATAWDILYATERKSPSRQEQWSRNMNRKIKCSIASDDTGTEVYLVAAGEFAVLKYIDELCHLPAGFCR